MLTQNARLLQQHDEAQRDGAHRGETQRAARDRKDQARRRAHTYSCREICSARFYYYYYYYYYSSLRFLPRCFYYSLSAPINIQLSCRPRPDRAHAFLSLPRAFAFGTDARSPLHSRSFNKAMTKCKHIRNN